MNEQEKAQWEKIKAWLDKKPRTTRYMSEQERALTDENVKKSVAAFKAWLEKNR